jgi:hypothetical protein
MLFTSLQEEVFLSCFQQRYCPLCRATWQLDTRRFDWYVNDGVLDEATLASLVRSSGFCSPHALTIILIEGSRFLWSHLGSCILFSTVLQQAFLPRLDQAATMRPSLLLPTHLRGWLSPLRPVLHPARCPLCQDHHFNETTCLHQFRDAFANDPTFRLAYAHSAGLCFPHHQQLCDQPMLSSYREELLLPRHKAKEVRDRLEHLRQLLDLLYGADMLLWSDARQRVETPMLSKESASGEVCRFCQEMQAQEHATLNHLAQYLEGQAAERKRHTLPPFSLCALHIWWLLHLCQDRPAMATHLESLLQSVVREVQPDQHIRREKPHPCLVCGWQRAREMPLLVAQQHKLQHDGQITNLCLSHGRMLLQTEEHNTETIHLTAQALLASLLSVRHRLNGYIDHCNEAGQAQMQPDEVWAWLDALHWFGGNDTLHCLLPFAAG